MLRTLALALILAAPSQALAQQFPDSPLGQEVRGHDGTVLGRITSVERDAEGNVVAVEIPGLEPADAPRESQVAARERAPLRVTRISEQHAARERNADAEAGSR
jgi:hypothetical protein